MFENETPVAVVVNVTVPPTAWSNAKSVSSSHEIAGETLSHNGVTICAGRVARGVAFVQTIVGAVVAALATPEMAMLAKQRRP